MLSIGWFDFLSIIQVYLQQLEAGSVSKLVGRYFWDKNVCCVLLPQHHVMIYLLMSKHRMSNDGMPFQRYNHTNWLLGRKGPGPKIMLSIFPSSRQSWYIFVCLLGQNTDGFLLSTIIMSCTMHMYWYLACIKWKVTYWFVSEEAKAVLLLSVYDNAQIESDFMPLVVVLMMMIWWQISALQF